MSAIPEIQAGWLLKLGEQIKEARNDADLTQQKLADRLGIRQAKSVIGWEKGTDRPSIDLLVRMGVMLDCAFDVGQFRISVKQTSGEPVPVLRKQNRLAYGIEYICELGTGQTMKLKPGKEGVLVMPDFETKSA